MTRVLVTGGAGFIGSHTVDLLLKNGYKVRVLDSLTPPVHEAGVIPDYMPMDDIEFVRGDVCNRADWQHALEGVDAVFHLAAYQDYLLDFSKFFSINSVGTALLYEVIVEKKMPIQKIVIASSQAIYGEGKYRCPNKACQMTGVQYPPLRSEAQLRCRDWEVRCPSCGKAMEAQCMDEAVVNPHNQYAISKHTQEMIALNLGKRYGIPSVAMRYSITQGPRQSFRNAYSGVLRIFVQRLLNGRQPVCYEDGRQVRDYVSVYDVARANMLVLMDPAAEYQAFNVGGEERITVLDYAHLIADRAGVNIEPIIPGEYRFGDTRHIFSDVSKLKRLGWYPEVPVTQIVDEYIAWARVQPSFKDYYAQAELAMKEMGTVRVASCG